MSLKSIAVLGAGGHAWVAADVVCLSGRVLAGFYAPGVSAEGISLAGSEEDLLAAGPDACEVTVGVGGPAARRHRIYQRFHAAGFAFATLIHPSAVVAGDGVLDPGVQVMAGAVVQPGAKVGANVILNTRSSVDHDCHIEPSAHIAPGATLCGGVKVGTRAHIGAGAVILPNVQIGANAIVGAGAVVTRDVAPDTVVKGVPARANL